MEISKMGIPPNNPKWDHFSVEAHRDLGIFQKPPYISFIIHHNSIYINYNILPERFYHHVPRFSNGQKFEWRWQIKVHPLDISIQRLAVEAWSVGWVPWGYHGATMGHLRRREKPRPKMCETRSFGKVLGYPAHPSTGWWNWMEIMDILGVWVPVTDHSSM